MPYYRAVGEVPRKRHTQFRKPDGSLYAEEPLRALVTEARGHVGPPRRYLAAKGQFLEHAPYCERDLRGPTHPHVAAGTEVDVLVRHRSGCTRYKYAHHPFDVIGWDGC